MSEMLDQGTIEEFLETLLKETQKGNIEWQTDSKFERFFTILKNNVYFSMAAKTENYLNLQLDEHSKVVRYEVRDTDTKKVLSNLRRELRQKFGEEDNIEKTNTFILDFIREHDPIYQDLVKKYK